MRILRLALVGLAATAAVFVGQREALAFESFFMTLSPSWGPSTTRITANYLFSAQGDKCGFPTVAFSWDRQPLGEAPVSRAGRDQGYCIARLTFTPPSGLAGPGRHVVHAEGKGRKNLVDVAFTITGAGAPPVQPAPSPTAGGAGSAGTRGTQPTAKPSARPSASALASAPPSTSAEPAGEPIASTSTAPVAALKSTSDGGSTGTVIAVVVMALTIVGAGLLAGLMLRKRGDSPEIPAEIVAAES
jgi:hypothetical protein